MGKQKAFFLSKYEIFQKEHPKKVKTRKSTRKSSSSTKSSSPKVFDCETCGLSKKCRHPKIERYGKGKKGILFVGMCPGPTEDKTGLPFVGASGELLKRNCALAGIDLDEDCIRTNIVRCYPGKDNKGRDKEPTKEQIKCCFPFLEKDIEETKPKMIICLGTKAIKTVLQTQNSSQLSAEMMHGKVIPYHKYGCWVGCLYHPSYFLHRKGSTKEVDDERLMKIGLSKILERLGEPLPKPLTEEGNECITDADEAVEMLHYFSDSQDPVAFDYETNMLSPYYEGAKILSVSFTNEVESAVFIPLGLKDKKTGKDIFTPEEQTKIALALADFLKSDAPKVVQNYNMEELWSRQILGQSMNNFIHDTMVTAHVLNCHPKTTGLEFQVLEMTGHEYKRMVNHNDLEKESLETLCNYNCWDARYTLMSYYRQKSLLKGTLKKFNDFLTSSLEVLANLTERGVRIDLEKLEEFSKVYSEKMESCKKIVASTPEISKYKEKFQKEFNIDSPTQIGKVLYEVFEEAKPKRTASGRGSTDVESLHRIQEETKNPRVKELISAIFEYRKASKVHDRVVEYKRLIDPKGYVHPTYNLNVARSYRSSADRPNIQNVFKRDEEQKKFRECIVPSPGNLFLEADYDGLEVRVIAMVSKDKELTRQIIEGVDTHRKWAAKIFEKPESEITKFERYRGKNEFVFPSFYGATEDSIARFFPEKPKDHVKEVCRQFWREFHGVKEWQERTIADYKKNGYVELVTGARRPGPLSLNKLYNTPIQGPAFHLNLDALRRIDEEMLRRKMKSKLIIEVHDSITVDAAPDELEELVDLIEGIMTSKRFEWQGDVPLSVSWEIGENWYEMEEI